MQAELGELVGVDLIVPMADELDGFWKAIEAANHKVCGQHEQEGLKPEGVVYVMEAKGLDPPEGAGTEMLPHFLQGEALRKQCADNGAYGEYEEDENSELRGSEELG